MPDFIVATPDDAWAILRDIETGELDQNRFYDIEARGWSLELLRLPTAERSSISIPLMRALIEYQGHINKSYKLIRYNRTTGTLPKVDREQIELNIVVGPNGSVYNAEVRKAIATFIKAAADRMESKHLTLMAVAVVLILSTGYFGRDAFKAWVASEAASRDLATHTDQIVKLSEQETERAKILGSLASKYEPARQALVRVESSYQPLLRAAASAESAQVLGVEVPQPIAKQLAVSPRRSGEGARLDGKYEVADIERHEIGVFSVVLKSSEVEGRSVTADARALFLPDDQIDLLLSSLKTGRQLTVMVNAWQRDGKPVTAEIARVDPPDPKP